MKNKHKKKLEKIKKGSSVEKQVGLNKNFTCDEVVVATEIEDDRVLVDVDTIKNGEITNMLTFNCKTVHIKPTEKVAINIIISDCQLRDGYTLQTQVLGLYKYCRLNNYEVVNVSFNVDDYEDIQQDNNLHDLVEKNEVTKIISLNPNIVSSSLNTLSTIIEIMEVNDKKIMFDNIIREEIEVIDNNSYLFNRFLESMEETSENR